MNEQRNPPTITDRIGRLVFTIRFPRLTARHHKAQRTVHLLLD